jgi:hypothetical protein
MQLSYSDIVATGVLSYSPTVATGAIGYSATVATDASSYSVTVATGASKLECCCCHGSYCATVLLLLRLLLCYGATVAIVITGDTGYSATVATGYSATFATGATELQYYCCSWCSCATCAISYWALLCYWCYCAPGAKVLPPLLCNGCFCAIMQLSYFSTYATLLLNGTCFGVAIESTYFFACTFQVTRKLIPLPCLVLAICTLNIVAPDAPRCMSFSIQRRFFSNVLLSFSLPVIFI